MSVICTLACIAIATAVGSVEAKRDKDPESGCIYLGTKFKDESLLKRALKIYGCKNVLMDPGLETDFDGSRIIFEKDQNGVFMATFMGGITLEDSKEFISDITDEYTKLVQEQVYQKLLNNAADHNLRLESERVEEDNSIVLTFAVVEQRNE